MDATSAISWQYTNVYANGELLATYDNTGLHFALNDWLGTKRVQASPAGAVELNCWNLPFNDGFGCSGPGSDSSNLHYTGKEHDPYTALDLFGAREYTNFSGRFLSPDWSTKPEDVPYADLSNPQSLNLYSYVNNNPLSKTDKDGHDQEPLDPQQMQSLGQDINAALAGIRSFASAHPFLTDLGINLGLAIITRGEGEGVSVPELSEGVPSAPSMAAAQRMGMREEGIPTSQQPVSQQNVTNSAGDTVGRQYTYEVPKPGGGTETKLVQRNVGTDSSHPGQPHVEVGSPKPGGQTDSLGRPRLDNNKTKINVQPPPPPPIQKPYGQ